MFYAIDYYEFQTGITTGCYSTQAHLTLFHTNSIFSVTFFRAVIKTLEKALNYSINIEIYFYLSRKYDKYLHAVIREVDA